jgi:DNA polymerase zeta
MDIPPPALEVHITQIDYSLDAPNSLDNTCLPKVPVLRIYGASSVGKKCCLHIHQVYPYFFVEYTGKISPGSGEQRIGCFRPRRVDDTHSEAIYRPVD